MDSRKEKLFDNLLSQEDIAAELGVSPRTVGNWMASGKMPCVKVGRRNMGIRSMIERWLESQKKRRMSNEV